MIEDYINNFELEFPIYEAVQKSDFVYYKKLSILKQMVKVANSYKNTPPCPTQGKSVYCISPHLAILKNIKRVVTGGKDHLTEMLKATEKLSKHDNPHQMLKNPILNSINKKRFKHMSSYFRTDAIPKR